MSDTIYILVAVSADCEDEPAVVETIENQYVNQKQLKVLETIFDDGATGAPIIYFP